jgi:hypothetical protein
VFLVNGHIYPQVERLADPADRYDQPPRLFAGRPGGRFDEREPLDSPIPRWSARGLAPVDLDNDGAIDLVVGVHNGRARVLKNRIEHNRGAFLMVQLVGTSGPRDGIGARATIEVAGRHQVRFAQPFTGYQGTIDRRLHFGLGTGADGRPNPVVRLVVGWPSGRVSELSHPPSGRVVRVIEP